MNFIAAERLSINGSAELFSGNENSLSVDVVGVGNENCFIGALVRITGTGAASGQTLLVKSFTGSIKVSIDKKSYNNEPCLDGALFGAVYAVVHVKGTLVVALHSYP